MRSKSEMKDFVINLLKANVPKEYTYHSYEHTLYVLEKSIEIGRYEECGEKELELLGVAALWHDAGYTVTYNDHEEESCRLARKYLPEYGYSFGEIDIVCGMINATKIPQSPKNKLEEILADADLEYLGSETFLTKSDSLFYELRSRDSSLSKVKWNQVQISFLQKHHYFTKFCNENREKVKQSHLQDLINSVV